MIGQRRLARPTSADVPVRNPASGTNLAPEGDVVTVDVFWVRRARDGDVELLPVPPVNERGERIAPPSEPPTEAAPTEDHAPTEAPTEDAPARARRTR